MSRAQSVQSIVIGRMAARDYADQERALRAAGYDEKADIARRAAMAEFHNPTVLDRKWCPCPACWRYLTRLEDWHDA